MAVFVHNQRNTRTDATTADYQLGNGKRSSLAVPQHLPMLVAHGVDGVEGKGKEAGLSSGTVSVVDVGLSIFWDWDWDWDFGVLWVLGYRAGTVIDDGYGCG